MLGLTRSRVGGHSRANEVSRLKDFVYRSNRIDTRERVSVNLRGAPAPEVLLPSNFVNHISLVSSCASSTASNSISVFESGIVKSL